MVVYDATNTTRERRNRVIELCKDASVRVFFVESVCDDKSVVMANVNSVKINSDDYKNMDAEDAAKDFLERIKVSCWSESQSV